MGEDNRLPLIREWYKSKQVLDTAKETEKDLRNQVLESVFGELTKGTKKHELPKNQELILSVSSKIKVDKDEFMKHKLHMEKKGLIGDESVIRMKPEVSATAYKYMNEEDKVAFDSVFVHYLDSPQLKIDTKKGK